MSIPLNHNTDTIVPSSGTLAITGNLTVSGTAPAPNVIGTVSTTTISTATETYVTPTYLIAANTLVAGQAYKLTISGYYSLSANQTTAFNLRLGTAGTTADTLIAGLTGSTTNVGTVGFVIQCQLTVRTIGSSGSAIGIVSVVGGGSGIYGTGANAIYAGNSAVTVNTTGALYLGLSISAGGTSNTFYVCQATVSPA